MTEELLQCCACQLIVQREPVFFDAPQHQRRGDDLRHAVEMERCDGFDRVGALDVLPAEYELPHDVARSDDRGREAGDGRLGAQRLEVTAKTVED